ncbi:putative hydrolase [Candidatus Rubidus massiliensis]|nr:putative hydrolase [Candidatus Rubidus massiliensis]
MNAKLTFLGTGASLGVPVIGCECPVCLSTNKKNKRTRSSVLIEGLNKTLLIDCGPDFRMQALNQSLKKIDGLILTHAHFDHIGGMDDLRALRLQNAKSLPTLLSKETGDNLKQCFHYMFEEKNNMFTSKLDFQWINNKYGKCNFINIPITYLTFKQTYMNVNGFVFGNLAFITDVKYYEEDIFNYLQEIDILIVSALRFTSSPMHLSVEEAIDFSKKTSAKQVWLIHISHDLDHEKTNALLPSNIQIAYDGLQISFHL